MSLPVIATGMVSIPREFFQINNRNLTFLFRSVFRLLDADDGPMDSAFELIAKIRESVDLDTLLPSR
ncbi:TPA: hypothetical protein QDC42_008026 [Burkholderia stabilis]|nr:hypothetical protein [Burkholderia stabilis]HDR9589733.1 hypothetical protein [Burkholderia stabilis]